eukprot:TRINITY_DN1390_c0_g2_i1.p1 TRINITY_DN1390_c0_g2~~TRINITY_DN1390_c0_g2_i1.p1  ORF type:complete len:551 (-),score=136.76 TRINITY_DN1390_c0_g2_i1:183-1682(-)
MTDATSSFQQGLMQILYSTALQHPYHTLYQIFALRNGDKVGDQKGKTKFIVDNDKKNAASKLINELKKSKADLIMGMEELVEAYIGLALLDCEDKKKETKPILLPPFIRKIKNQKLLAVPTINMPVDHTGQYREIVHIMGLGDTYTLVGGLNLPKRIECKGSNGVSYKQLVKGRDDLRQDAVMQQIFGLVNILLQENPETKKRRLNIRTYKVIPLSPCAGLLEWVENTTPIGEYLVGSQQQLACAHSRYRPRDALSLECRKELQEAAEKDKPKKYQEIQEKFKPVFHHFFLEKFPDPVEWFQKRLAYTRSAASSSIVGYIVGLGDRHSQNILIDVTSAELVHIDLGVAFEQGKTLRTPEVVPFRLTRDIVDGMGVTGYDGVFTRCCEATMTVLRENQAALLTIVEVFIHDPLFKWALSPLQALRVQRDFNEFSIDEEGTPNSATGNTDAERTLLRIKQKLQGYEYGETLTVVGQVHQLINEATDEAKLCRMFPGWAPWV